MIFNINIGFADLDNESAKDAAGKTVALFVGDTVVVGDVINPQNLISDRLDRLFFEIF